MKYTKRHNKRKQQIRQRKRDKTWKKYKDQQNYLNSNRMTKY